MNSSEEIQALAKSILARRVKDVLDDPRSPDAMKVKIVRELVESVINPGLSAVCVGRMAIGGSVVAGEIKALSQKVLAKQIGDIVGGEGGSDEKKVAETRALVEYFIIDL